MIDRGDFERISEVDLLELIDGQVPEGLFLDYKRTLYGIKESDNKEFLKDVSSFANSHGGHLIIGIEEKKGLPASLQGLTEIDHDKEILRFEQLLRTGIEPRLLGVRIRAIPIEKGGHVFIIRVPKSWNPPHRVIAQNSNRFYIRNSGGVHEASMDELRNLFTLSSSVTERIRSFRNERISEIVRGDRIRPLVGGGRFILHIVPLSAFLTADQVDLRAVMDNRMAFWPIDADGFNPRFNFDGVINERGIADNNGYTQIFRNGIIEATKAGIIQEWREKMIIAGTILETMIREKFSKYIEGMRTIGIRPPLVVMMAMEGVKGITYTVGGGLYGGGAAAIERDPLLLPDCIIEDYGEEISYHRAIRPAFDALWNLTGSAEALTFNKDGLWTGLA